MKRVFVGVGIIISLTLGTTSTGQNLSDPSNADPSGQTSASQSQPSDRQPSWQFFTDEAAFLKAARKVIVEGFEGFPHQDCGTQLAQATTQLSTASFSVQIVPYILYPFSAETLYLCVGDSNLSYDPGAGPSEGVNALIAGSATGSTYNVMFSLSSPTYAVGFDFSDVAERIGEPVELSGNGNFEFFGERDASGALPAATISPCCSGPHEGFFGYASTEPFSSFFVRTQGRNNVMAIDRIQLGTKRSQLKRRDN